MALLDIFKKKKVEKKGETKKGTKEVSEIKAEKKIEKHAKEKVEPKESPRPKTKTSSIAYRILKKPHITERATDLTKINQYIFEVWPRSNKTEIRKAVEELYGVNVESVNVIKIPAKKRRLGKTSGWKKGYKKAIVKLREGEKIEVLPR